MVRPVLLGSVALAIACRDKGPEDSFPSPGAPEAVSVIWEGSEQPGAFPSVVELDGSWQMYFTGAEGTLQGTLHASSEDGQDFVLVSGHRVLDDVVASTSDSAQSAVAYVAGSTVHLLSNVTRSGVSEVWHAKSTDGHTFTPGAGASFAAAASPATGEPETYTVTGAIYAPIDGIAWMRVDNRGSNAAATVSATTSSDGGASWSTATEVLTPDDIPEPWGSSTVGAGGIWGATVAVAADGGYHMLYLGAKPNGDSALGIGHAFSADLGETWTLDGDLWYAPDDGLEISGLSLLADDEGYWLYFGTNPSGGDAVADGAFFRMRIE